MNILSFGLTHTGHVRSQNEDAFLVDDKLGVYAVADGLGGLPEGAYASRLAISLLHDLLLHATNEEARADLLAIFDRINQRVYAEGLRLDHDLGIGTTLTVAKICGTKLLIGHAGDCAVFLYRANTARQLTTDHTMEQEVRSRLKPGDNTFIPDYFAHTLTRCVGQKDRLVPDLVETPLAPGDRLLIVSDGITKTISDRELHLLALRHDSPEKLAHALIDQANEQGGPDNSTAIALYLTA